MIDTPFSHHEDSNLQDRDPLFGIFGTGKKQKGITGAKDLPWKWNIWPGGVISRSEIIRIGRS